MDNLIKDKSPYPTRILLIVISGVLFIAFSLIIESIENPSWILWLVPLYLSGGLFIIMLLIVLFKKDRNSSVVGLSLLTLIIAIVLALSTELFKNEKILEAILMDDLSGIHLTLRTGQQFEVTASGLFSKETYTGQYELIGNKIIFLDQPYDNDFIPDTVYIIDDKIILRFDKKGEPITSFATFFKIHSYKIKKKHQTDTE